MKMPKTAELMPTVLPASWRPVAIGGVVIDDAFAYDNAFGLHVIASVEDRGPATGTWLHVSMSKRNRLPSWDEVREVKDLFIGRDRCALHMVPPAEFYINLHPYTLHLWSRLDAPSVPVALYEDR